MTKRIFDAGSVVGLIALIAFGVFAVAGGLGGSETKAADQGREASCLAGSGSCDDTGGAALGVCAPGFTDCVDTVVGGDGDTSSSCLAPVEDGGSGKPCDTPDVGGVNPVCAPDQPECIDGSSGGGGQPIVVEPGAGSGSAPGNAGCGDEVCQKAVDTAWSLLEEDGVSGEITLLGAKGVDWPNACIGITRANVACAEVITPGFVVALERNGKQYTFNTDLNGNAVSADN